MDVKNSTAVEAGNRELLNTAATSNAENTKTEDKSLKRVAVGLEDQVSIEEGSTQLNESRVELRKKLNHAIDALNLAEEGTSEIGKIIHGLSGLVTQAESSNDNARQISLLQGEAQELVQALAQHLKTSLDSGEKPLAGDTVRVELEKTIGRALELILPDNSKDNFGLGVLHFSPKDAILQARENVERARQRLDSLRDALRHNADEVRRTTTAVEVAIQNQEAFSSSVREVSQALDLAIFTKSGISGAPESALASIGRVRGAAFDLLK